MTLDRSGMSKADRRARNARLAALDLERHGASGPDWWDHAMLIGFWVVYGAMVVYFGYRIFFAG